MKDIDAVTAEAEPLIDATPAAATAEGGSDWIIIAALLGVIAGVAGAFYVFGYPALIIAGLVGTVLAFCGLIFITKG
ncbi:MAG: hypothetical protein AAFR17_02655 [Pseudomonadota bacterium]